MAGAALYLVWFGSHRLYLAKNDKSVPVGLSPKGALHAGLPRTAIALAFANPYAWIDTVVVLGAMGGNQIPDAKIPFALGAMSASLVWFNLLAYGSTRFKTLFQSRLAWRLLDVATALMMFYFAFMLFDETFRFV